MADSIYHLAAAADWAAAQTEGTYRGSETDHADGFIHFSTAEQVAGSAARHRAGRTDLVLLTVDTAHLTSDLRWEESRNGILFPHLYGPLNVSAVQSATPIGLDDRGRHRFPPDIPPLDE